MAQHESKLVRNSLNDLAPNNSDKAAQGAKTEGKEKKKLAPLVSKGSVAKKKRTVADKFKDAFLGESENLGDYIMYDVLVPAFRDTVSEMGFGIIERLFGNGRSSRSRGSVVRDRGRSYVSYNSSSRNDRDRDRGRDDRRDIDRGSRARHSFDKIVFTHKWEAEDVLAHLVDMTLEYGEVTVRSFYELSNIDSKLKDYVFKLSKLSDKEQESIMNLIDVMYEKYSK